MSHNLLCHKHMHLLSYKNTSQSSRSVCVHFLQLGRFLCDSGTSPFQKISMAQLASDHKFLLLYKINRVSSAFYCLILMLEGQSKESLSHFSVLGTQRSCGTFSILISSITWPAGSTSGQSPSIHNDVEKTHQSPY